MSKRSRTGALAGKAPTKKPAGGGSANGNGRKQVGSRDFARRARASGRPMATAQRDRPRLGLLERAIELPSLPWGELWRRIPRAAWMCALVACLSAVCWSIVTPPFQSTDEPDHFAYVKQLAETGSLPTSREEETSEEEAFTLISLHYYKVRQQPQRHTIASHSEQSELERMLASGPHSTGSAEVGVALSQPPLYYALEAFPYTLAGGNELDRLALMRLMSALFAGLTALFAFLFLREALPGAPWAWTVGGLCVALAPLLGAMSGSVNPDSMLFAVSAATFYLLARAFRRGLGTRTAAAVGAVTAIGIVTKLNFVGLLPGVALAMVALSVRARRTSGASLTRLLALSLGIGFSPAILYAAVNVLSHHSLLGIVSATVRTTHGSPLAQLDYIWQLYLPHVPGTANYFPGLFTPRLWFDDYVGLYGFLDTTFPGWVDTLALIPACAIALLLGRALVQERAALRSRWLELAVYALMALGLLVLVGADSFRVFPKVDAEYAQPRYLLPLLAPPGAALALAARAAGRRWGPAVGALMVVAFLAHDVLSQMLVAGRFYV